jgi:L-asparaginase
MKVLCIATGGTIASRFDPARGGFVPTVPAQELVAAADGIGTVVEVLQLAQTNSTSFDPQQVLDWSKMIGSALERPDLAGAVFLQGTNTIEECAFLFDLALETEKPVVFSGSMRAADEVGFDGPRTLAVAVAADSACRGLGVLVVLDDEIHAAREVEKQATSGLNAFQSPGRGPIGRVGGQVPRVCLGRRPRRGMQIRVDRLETEVALVACAMGIGSAPIDAALSAGARGIVFAALGSGDLPGAMVPGVERALGLGVTLVVARSVASGRVGPRYADPGEGRWLADRGVRFAGDLNAVKARIKLMMVLGAEQARCRPGAGGRVPRCLARPTRNSSRHLPG